MTSSQQQEESIASEVLAASLGGAVSASVLYPLEVLKTKMQAENQDEDEHCNDDDNGNNNKNVANYDMVEYAQHMYKTQGPFVFLDGMQTSAFQSAMEKALYFFAYTALKHVHYSFLTGGSNNKNKKTMSTLTNLFLGCLAEWAHLPITLPLDCWTSAIQTNTDKSQGPMTLLVNLLSEKGLKGMYKGIQAYVVLCLKPAIQYTVFEQLRVKRLQSTSKSSLSAAEAFGLGMMARAISTIVVFPYIRAKVLLQTSSSSDSSTSIGKVLKDTYQNGGCAVLFRGLGPELTRGVLSSALMLMIKERIAALVQSTLLHGGRVM